MDIGLFIVLMIVVYVVPELLKRLKKKKPYQYPDFPAPMPPTGQYPSPPGIPGELSRGMKPPPMPLYAVQEEGTAGDEGDPVLARYAEVFAYDENQAMLSLDNPV